VPQDVDKNEKLPSAESLPLDMTEPTSPPLIRGRSGLTDVYPADPDQEVAVVLDEECPEAFAEWFSESDSEEDQTSTDDLSDLISDMVSFLDGGLGSVGDASEVMDNTVDSDDAFVHAESYLMEEVSSDDSVSDIESSGIERETFAQSPPLSSGNSAESYLVTSHCLEQESTVDAVEANESRGEEFSQDFSSDSGLSVVVDHEDAVSAESDTQSEGVDPIERHGLDSISSTEEVPVKDLDCTVEENSEDSHLNPDNGIVASEEMGGQEVEADVDSNVSDAIGSDVESSSGQDDEVSEQAADMEDSVSPVERDSMDNLTLEDAEIDVDDALAGVGRMSSDDTVDSSVEEDVSDLSDPVELDSVSNGALDVLTEDIEEEMGVEDVPVVDSGMQESDLQQTVSPSGCDPIVSNPVEQKEEEIALEESGSPEDEAFDMKTGAQPEIHEIDFEEGFLSSEEDPVDEISAEDLPPLDTEVLSEEIALNVLAELVESGVSDDAESDLFEFSGSVEEISSRKDPVDIVDSSEAAFSGKIFYVAEQETIAIHPKERRLKQLMHAIRERKAMVSRSWKETHGIRKSQNQNGLEKKLKGGILSRMFGAYSRLYGEVDGDLELAGSHLTLAVNHESQLPLLLANRRKGPSVFYQSSDSDKAIAQLEIALRQYGLVIAHLSMAKSVLLQMPGADEVSACKEPGPALPSRLLW